MVAVLKIVLSRWVMRSQQAVLRSFFAHHQQQQQKASTANKTKQKWQRTVRIIRRLYTSRTATQEDVFWCLMLLHWFFPSFSWTLFANSFTVSIIIYLFYISLSLTICLHPPFYPNCSSLLTILFPPAPHLVNHINKLCFFFLAYEKKIKLMDA